VPPSDDDAPAGSDLDRRRDPNRRSKPKESVRFSGNPRPPEDQHPPGTMQRSRADRGRGEELVIKGGYRYVVAAATSPSFPTGSAPGPYHLHPQRGSPDGDTSGDRDRPRSSGLRSPEVAQTLGKGDTAAARQTESNHAEAGENPAQPRQNVPETQEAAAGKQSKNSLKLKWSPLPAKRNLERTREDIVERNKITLGRNTSKRGSYLKAHAPKPGTDDVTVCGE